MLSLCTTLCRPLFWDFPADPAAWRVTDQFMFGSDYMMAPVTDMGARTKMLYLPAGASFTHFFTNKSYVGGQNVSVNAPLDEFPLFKVVRPSV
jgi:alpha-D-xyloside xylohydrolase